MLKLIVAAFGLGACACAALAQSEVEAQADVILPDGRRNLVITNRSAKTITAFAYQYRYSIVAEGGSSVPERSRDEFKDSVLYPVEPAVGPGRQVAVPVGLVPAQGERVMNYPVEFKAAVFDDGSAFGDPVWVARIRDRRLIVIETLDSEIALLKGPPKGAKPNRESLASELEGQKAARVGADPDPDHRRIIGGQYDATIHNLTSARQSPEKVEHFMQTQRDRMAKAAGVMYPAMVVPANVAPR